MHIVILKLIFLLCFAICFYVYFGYPLLLLMLSYLFKRPVRKGDFTPLIALIIPAHNEQKVIAEKLENTLNLDYPKDKLEIIVVSDGSTDRTEEIVKQYEGKRVSLISLPRSGKIIAFNAAVNIARGEILVFTDANSVVQKQALLQLTSNFNDTEVGGVCGDLKYQEPLGGNPAGESERLYWDYDKLIKKLESRLGSTVSASGSFYAIRRRLFMPLSDPSQADDLAISASVVVKGYRLVFEPEAISYESPPSSSNSEFRRKVRVANQTINALLNLKQALNPLKFGFYAIELLSHKVLRYLVPFFLVIAFFANILLAPESEFYKFLLILQIVFYGLAIIGYRMRSLRSGTLKIFYGPFYFCLANTAVLIAALSALRGKRVTTWQPERE